MPPNKRVGPGPRAVVRGRRYTKRAAIERTDGVGTRVTLPEQLSAPFTTMDGLGYEGTIEWRSPRVRSLVFTSRCAKSFQSGAQVQEGRRLFCNYNVQAWSTTGYTFQNEGNGGHILLEYGTQATQKRIYIDAADQSVQLPPCSYARASVRRRNPTDTAANLDNTFIVDMAFAPGHVHPDTPLPLATTEIGLCTGGAAAKSIPKPPGANEYSVWVSQGNLPATWSANFGPGNFVDYSVPIAFPSHRNIDAPFRPITFTVDAGASDNVNTSMLFKVAP